MERSDLLEESVNRRSPVITSQLPVKKWHENIGDPTLADSIQNRVVHRARRIELKGLTMRRLPSDEKE